MSLPVPVIVTLWALFTGVHALIRVLAASVAAVQRAVVAVAVRVPTKPRRAR